MGKSYLTEKYLYCCFLSLALVILSGRLNCTTAEEPANITEVETGSAAHEASILTIATEDPEDTDRETVFSTGNTTSTPPPLTPELTDEKQDIGLLSGIIAAAIAFFFIVLSLLAVLLVVICMQWRKKSAALSRVIDVAFNATSPKVILDPIGDATLQDARIYYNQAQDQKALRRAKPRSNTTLYRDPADSEAKIYAELKRLKTPNISESQIKLGDEIGSGQFGLVYKGNWTLSPGKVVSVAVKTLKTDADKIKFLQEGAIMAQFKHRNVVAIILYGVTKKNGQRMLVIELLTKGDLLKYLRHLKANRKELVDQSTPHSLLEFSWHIAIGMNYLSSVKFVHRDLAARNILISEHNICKIADFGMARDLQNTSNTTLKGEKVPFKWTAPEALKYKKYSTASDVWSYGCVLYEMWSLGTKPFDNTEAAEVLLKLEEGFRLPPKEYMK